MVPDDLSEATLEVSTPQVTLGFHARRDFGIGSGDKREGGVEADRGFTLSGSQTAVFEVSVDPVTD